jgi:hypothetical protein
VSDVDMDTLMFNENNTNSTVYKTLSCNGELNLRLLSQKKFDYLLCSQELSHIIT